MVRLSLRCHFPRAFGIACILSSYSFALILSDPARKALPIHLSYPTVVRCFCCAHNVKSLEPATGLCFPPSSLLRHLVAIALFDCMRYLVALPFHAYLKRNSDINRSAAMFLFLKKAYIDG